MIRHRNRVAILAIAGLLLVGAGCSSSDEKGSKPDGNEVTTTTSGSPAAPSTTVVPPASTSTDPPASGTTDPPEGVPDGIAMPEGIELGPWQESTVEGKRVLTIEGTISDAEGSGPEVFDWITASLTDMGYSLPGSLHGENGGRYRASTVGIKDDHSVKVTVTEVVPDIRVNYEVYPED